MLEVTMANSLIDQLSEYTSYNINIMNKDGIIIASRDKNRIGSFHEVAYKLIRSNSDIEYTYNDDEFLGVLSGANMLLKVNDEVVGVLGITGDPDDIKQVALVVKMAVEALIKYETIKEKAFRRQTSKERFIYMVTEQNDAEYKELRRFANELNYTENISRVPIIITFNSQTHRDSALSIIKLSDLHSSEDISTTLHQNDILIFKTLEGDKMISNYKNIVNEYISAAFSDIDIEYKYFVGTIQNNFMYYHNAYKQTEWLSKNIVAHDKAVYFYDYVSRYIIDIMPREELDSIFKVFDENLDKNFKRSFVEIIGALIDSDFNLVQAAKNSFMHRNTFLYRYKKIRETFENGENDKTIKCLLIWLKVYFGL